MMFLSRAESSYLHQHLSVVRHVTLDPEGPGVLRIHLLPCKKARRNVPFVALLNGQDILPLRLWKPPLLFTRKRLPTRSARI